MRDLTKKQKTLLKKWFNDKKPTEIQRIVGVDNRPSKASDLSLEQLEILEKINDTEVLYQAIDSFLHDLIWAEL